MVGSLDKVAFKSGRDAGLVLGFGFGFITAAVLAMWGWL